MASEKHYTRRMYSKYDRKIEHGRDETVVLLLLIHGKRVHHIMYDESSKFVATMTSIRTESTHPRISDDAPPKQVRLIYCMVYCRLRGRSPRLTNITHSYLLQRVRFFIATSSLGYVTPSVVNNVIPIHPCLQWRCTLT